MKKPYAAEWLEMRAASPSKYAPIQEPHEPPEEGWTWNKAKTSPVHVTKVKVTRWFNAYRDTLEATKGRGNTFPWSQYFETEGQAREALLAYQVGALDKACKQVKLIEVRIAAIKSPKPTKQAK